MILKEVKYYLEERRRMNISSVAMKVMITEDEYPQVLRCWRGILCASVLEYRHPVVVGTRLLLRLMCGHLNF